MRNQVCMPVQSGASVLQGTLHVCSFFHSFMVQLSLPASISVCLSVVFVEVYHASAQSDVPGECDASETIQRAHHALAV